MTENKPDTVPGLGFKDKEKANETIEILKGRDPDYQKLAVKGLIGRAKRVLTLTKDKEKLQNINLAIKIFDEWLKDFDNSNLSKENRAYLPLGTIKSLKSLVEKYKLQSDDAISFYKAYEKVKGEYKYLRTVESTERKVTWDILRNKKLKVLMKKFNEDNPNLWDDDLPTKAHMEMIVWAYSPDATRIKKNISKIEEKLGVTNSEEDRSDSEESDNENGKKRKSSSSSQSGNEESPRKKTKK